LGVGPALVHGVAADVVVTRRGGADVVVTNVAGMQVVTDIVVIP
jgi:hypothetical protein